MNSSISKLFGRMKETRAILPVMRKELSGHIISISSTAGLVGRTFCSAYSASKFGIEGWVETLQTKIGQFGINTTIVNSGFFRTEVLTEESTSYANHPIDDYNGIREQTIQFWKDANGHQPGNPAKLAEALVEIAQEGTPPFV